VLVPTITNIVNLSLTFGQFHPILKESVISPLLKKSTLDENQLSNCRPIPNLSLISKIIERIMKSRLTDHLTSNKLLNPHQSAYCKHHSTETALLYIHDHLVDAIGSQKLSCLCLLDLPAAFDTIATASYSLVSPLGSVSMALSSTGLVPTCHLAHSVSDVITLFRPCVPPRVVFPRLRSRSPAFHHVHYPSQHSHLLPFTQSPPLCR